MVAAIRCRLHVFWTWHEMTHDPRALPTLAESDYEAIELAVMETARGRWFLREYAARNRQADTTMLLQAINRLEGAVSGERAMEQIERIRFDLLEMAKSIAGLKIELDMHDEGGAEQSRFGDATSALDAIVRTTEQATSNILGATEQVQEIAWNLREQQYDEATCDRIDTLATEIYTACGFQDLTAQRTQKVVRTLRFLEGRINALVDAWVGKDGRPGEPAAAQPPGRAAEPMRAADGLPVPELSQSDVDVVIIEDDFPGAVTDQVSAPAPRAPAPGALPAYDASQLDDDDVAFEMVDVGGESFAPAMAKVASDLAEDMAAEQAASRPVLGLASGHGPAADQADRFAGLAEGTDLMANDEEPMVIDDEDCLEVDFVINDQEDDVVADMTAKPLRAPAPEMAGESVSLAQIDAMPTTAKALIFG
jgi:chemotaxis regulatin CheY-phosphate phosphatase CheZ